MASSNVEPQLPAFTAAGVLAPAAPLLRLTTAGSVDDGKSTLIGRLLYDSHAIYEDQLAAVRASRINRSGRAMDLSLLTDGLRAEREQGITIDVAYRYFSTPQRKFIIADTPGHEQYTRNMATGASTADAAIVLIDATRGVQMQSRRHAYIASLLGIRHVIAAVNKMDLAGFSETTFTTIAHEASQLGERLGIEDLYILPISALDGDNIVDRSRRTPWFQGPSLLEHLQNIELGQPELHREPARFPVQYVVRPDSGFRGFAGQVEAGRFQTGDPVTVFPSRQKTRIKSIVTFDGERESAVAGEAVTFTLHDEIDVSRGELLVGEDHPPIVADNFIAKLVWMHAEPLKPGKLYLLKHTTRTVRARIARVRYRVDIDSLSETSATELHMNDIASVEIRATLPLFFDPYQRIRAMGSFILIDPMTNSTVAAGMIDSAPEVLTKLSVEHGGVGLRERELRHGHRSSAIWLDGRYKVAEQLERTLFDQGWNVHLVRGDFDPGQLEAIASVLATSASLVIFASVGSPPEWLPKYFASDALFSIEDRESTNRETIARTVKDLCAWRLLSTE